MKTEVECSIDDYVYWCNRNRVCDEVGLNSIIALEEIGYSAFAKRAFKYNNHFIHTYNIRRTAQSSVCFPRERTPSSAFSGSMDSGWYSHSTSQVALIMTVGRSAQRSDQPPFGNEGGRHEHVCVRATTCQPLPTGGFYSMPVG